MNEDAPDLDPFDALCEAYLEALREGRAPDIEDLAEEHPQLAPRIRRLFPMLQVMEGVKQTGPAPASLAAPPDLPEQVGPYRIVRRLGRGGMGQVLEATGPDGERVALKLIHAHLVEEEEYLARFRREAEAGRRIEHPGVVRTLEAGSAVLGEGQARQPFIVLEYVDGQNLRELLSELGTISERLARVIGARVADALAAIHAAGMVHRDLKPENVLITPDEEVRVMDLGVALIQDEAMRLSRSGVFVGSFLYAAPEQLRGRDLDGRADLYSLGLILHELIAGHLPEADDEAGLLPQVGGGRIAAQISPFLTHLIRALIAPAATDRIADAAEAAQLLRDGERSTWWRGQPDVEPQRTHAVPDSEPRFRGRQHELRLLEGLAQQAAAGRGHVLLLEGEAGLGKSRLLAEWWSRQPLSAPGAPARIDIRFEPPGAYAPGDGVVDGLRRFLGEAHVEPALESLLGSDHADLSVARSVLVPPTDASRGATRSAEAPIEGAVRAVLRAVLAQRPVVLVVEDLHFAPEVARALVSSLSATVREERMLIVVTSRSEEGGGWPDELLRLAHVERYALPGLETDACHALLDELLGTEAGATPASRDLLRSADGNPFYVVELARAFRERQTQSDLTLRDTPIDARIPATVRALVESRLGSLPDEERDLLQAAACCGAVFDPVLVCDALEVQRIGGLKRFHRLDRQHALLEARGPRYRFRHHLVLEILYDELPEPLRRELHGALGRTLAARGAPTGAAALDILRHFLLAARVEEALPFAEAGLGFAYDTAESAKAEELALRLLEHAEALGRALHCRTLCILAHCEVTRAEPEAALQHFEAAHRLAAAQDDPALRAEVAVHYGYALRRAGHMQASAQVLEEAVVDGQAADVIELVGLARSALVGTLILLGRVPEARAAGEAALAIAQAHKLPTLEARAAQALGALEVEAGDHERGATLLEHAWARASIAGDWTTEINAMTTLVKLTFMRGDVEGAIALNERLLARGRALGHVQVQANCHINGANLLNAVGRLDEARERGLQGLQLCERTGHAQGMSHANLIVGYCHMTLGDWAGAVEHLGHALDHADAMGDPAQGASLRGRLAAIHGWMGDFDTAHAYLERGEALVPGETASAHGILGLSRADLLGAQGDYAASIALMDELEPRIMAAGRMPQVLSLWLIRGLFRLEIGDHEGALEDLDRLKAQTTARGAPNDRRLQTLLLGVARGDEETACAMLLREHGSQLSAHRRAHVLRLLGDRYDNDGWRQQAAEGLATLIDSAPAALHAAMRNAVPLHRRILAYARG